MFHIYLSRGCPRAERYTQSQARNPGLRSKVMPRSKSAGALSVPHRQVLEDADAWLEMPPESPHMLIDVVERLAANEGGKQA